MQILKELFPEIAPKSWKNAVALHARAVSPERWASHPTIRHICRIMELNPEDLYELLSKSLTTHKALTPNGEITK